jgi:hypothetical protein
LVGWDEAREVSIALVSIVLVSIIQVDIGVCWTTRLETGTMLVSTNDVGRCDETSVLLVSAGEFRPDLSAVRADDNDANVGQLADAD